MESEKEIGTTASSASPKTDGHEPSVITTSIASIPPHTIYTFAQKSLILTIVTIAAMFSGFAGNSYFPAIPTIAQDLQKTTELINLTVTVYMVFQAVSPTFWGAVSDTMGRRVTYMLTFAVFIGACVGLAETRHYHQLIILRCLQSTGSASTIAIGSGVIGDITVRENRGVGIYQGFLLVPSALGPVVGGLFSANRGWRWIFWFLAIFAGAFLVLLVVVLPETLRALVGNGSIRARGPARSVLGDYQRRRYVQQHRDPAAGALSRTKSPMMVKKPIDFLAPLRIVAGGQVTCAIVFLSFYYAAWQTTLAGLSPLLQRDYGLDAADAGLAYLANGVGCIIGTVSAGKLLDHDYARAKAAHAGPPADFPLERARLRSAWYYAGMEIAAAVAFGWAVQRRVHVAAPLVAVFFVGWASTAIQSIVTTLLVDVFDRQSASATAALNLCRCLVGAAGTAAVLPLVDAMGAGWGFVTVALALVLCCGLLFAQIRFGPGWRKRRAECADGG